MLIVLTELFNFLLFFLVMHKNNRLFLVQTVLPDGPFINLAESGLNLALVFARITDKIFARTRSELKRAPKRA